MIKHAYKYPIEIAKKWVAGNSTAIQFILITFIDFSNMSIDWNIRNIQVKTVVLSIGDS
jgi:hypothetical protein